MRPQQQNRRMRGRNNNNNNNQNRKGPNPLTRSYESNGPDVKIRGSAQQIAEKYAALARDATSSGDRVMAENYLQHAEHYNRIIAAAQAQMPIQHQQNGRDDADEDGDDERDEFDNLPMMAPAYGQGRQRGENNGNQNQGGFNGGNGASAPQATPPVNHAEAPQPVIEGMPAEVAFNAEMGGERRENRFRDGRERRRDRRFDNLSGVLNGGQSRADGETAQPVRTEAPAVEQAPAAVEPSVAETLPSAPAGAEMRQAAVQDEGAVSAGSAADGDGSSRRGRRPRRTRRPEGEEAQAAGGETPAPDLDPNLAPVAE